MMEILSAILTGSIMGLSTLLFIGPVLFYLLQTSVDRGRRLGYIAALGIIVGDLIYVVMISNGFSHTLSGISFQKYAALFGALVLILFGVSNLLGNQNKKSEEKVRPPSSAFKVFLNSFILNFVNPFVAMVWIGFLTLNKSTFSSVNLVYVSLASTLLIIFATDLLKVYFADKLRKLLTPERMNVFSKGVGILMLVFAIRLLYTYISL